MAEEEKKEAPAETPEEKKEDEAEAKKEEAKEEAKPEARAEEKKEEIKKEEKKEGKVAKEEVKVPKEFKKMVDEISQMSVLDLSKLVKVLEDKFGVSASSALVAAPAAAVSGGQGASGETEKQSFNVLLKAVGDKKIEVIKVVRDVMGKGLKDSKDLVDAVEKGPQAVKDNVKKEEAEELREKFSAAGATVELK